MRECLNVCVNESVCVSCFNDSRIINGCKNKWFILPTFNQVRIHILGNSDTIQARWDTKSKEGDQIWDDGMIIQ